VAGIFLFSMPSILLIFCFSIFLLVPQAVAQEAQKSVQETQQTIAEKDRWRITGKHAEEGLVCRSCHFSDKPSTPAPQAACIECHGVYKGSPASTHDLAVGRRRFKVNVHDAHPGQLDCTLCHAAHKMPTLYCNTCHTFKIEPK